MTLGQLTAQLEAEHDGIQAWLRLLGSPRGDMGHDQAEDESSDLGHDQAGDESAHPVDDADASSVAGD